MKIFEILQQPSLEQLYNKQSAACYALLTFLRKLQKKYPDDKYKTQDIAFTGGSHYATLADMGKYHLDVLPNFNTTDMRISQFNPKSCLNKEAKWFNISFLSQQDQNQYVRLYKRVVKLKNLYTKAGGKFRG